MVKHSSATRRAWMRHYLESKNVSATCRAFGISRATFYRWLRRYDPAKPSKPLRSHSHATKNRPVPKWTQWDLMIVAELNMRYPRLGAGRLAIKMEEDFGAQWSRATVGRLLHRVNERCPICHGRQGVHDPGMHMLKRDLWRGAPSIRQWLTAEAKP